MVLLADVISLLDESGQLVGCLNSEQASKMPVTGLDCDSRVVRPGHVFVCKGVAFRPDYLVSALHGGALAYLAEESVASELVARAPGTPALIVRDARVAMAIAAPRAWDHPERLLRLSGITGTKGKTTSSYLLRSMLDVAAGREGATALVGSVETYDGVERRASVNTTPEAPDLWRHLAHARDAGLRDVVMEVSSQALKYHRVDGLDFEVVSFLNLGRDHISPVEHPSFDDYRASKLRLFGQASTAVVNAGGEHMGGVLAAARARCAHVITFSVAGDRSADAYATDLRPSRGEDVGPGGLASIAGTAFVAHFGGEELEVRVPLPGVFNVDNALAAIAMAHELGVGGDAIATGIARTRVPGRMELIDDGAEQGIVGIVDFAHNAMALSRLLPAVRETWPQATLVAVFGATGGKGIERRVEMADMACRWADHLIFTEDDPGDEPVADICAAMVRAVDGRVPCEVVLDRVDAVEHAVQLACSWGRPTVICLVGRGTEPTMHRGDELVPFPLDGDLLRRALRRI